ncbi:MAG TPA: hypothetical protein DDY21_00300 [Candidatus Moranbacteria bacterium]|nr:hypothetical protein [Candidatus Moranbacteria bacterium]
MKIKTLKDFLIELNLQKVELEKARKISNFFKVQLNDGRIVRGGEALTDGQLEIFYAIIFRPSNRININCCTQYGKSLTVAMACVYLTTINGMKIAVVAPSDKKTKLIMRYYVDHLGDNKLFACQLEAETRLERLRQEGSKERIILRNGGGIYGISAQAANSNKSIEAAMGEGADICFPAGQKIMTRNGEIDIMDIVEKRMDCKVLSFNHENGKEEYRDIINYQRRKIGGRYLLEIDLGDRKIKCTNNHPIWVESKGYIRADKIKEGDMLWVEGL